MIWQTLYLSFPWTSVLTLQLQSTIHGLLSTIPCLTVVGYNYTFYCFLVLLLILSLFPFHSILFFNVLDDFAVAWLSGFAHISQEKPLFMKRSGSKFTNNWFRWYDEMIDDRSVRPSSPNPLSLLRDACTTPTERNNPILFLYHAINNSKSNNKMKTNQ